ncbi:TPM domain-containing protein [Terriglobus aquaticus]|uniref:TPM domain-containing protein n=1 Tax=Terriglobus aquaticus TaxID=940139 RepID=A0ABW9KIA2_9BACT|nr:TPM domain-containing protein [Terriglobus aquaticus]
MATRQSRLYVVLLCCLGLFWPVLHAESVKTMGPPSNYVTDLAGVLNPSTQSDLNTLLKALDTQAKAQVFVVTVHKIDDDEPVEQFANELFAKWKPGGAKTDRGVLMVFSIEDRKRWIEVGYGLEGILPDGKTGDIGRDMVPDLQAANYDGAVRAGVNEIADVIAKDAGVTLDTQPKHTYHREGSSQSSGGFGLFGSLFLLFILFLLFRGGRGGRGGGGYGGGGGGGFLSGLILGNLLGGGRSWGGRGGGWGDGGGGGWGGGDGGGSFGGGDGGSSGGGGAGGGW